MNFLIAPDSFKHSLTAKKVADFLAEGILRVFPDAEIIKVPVADGGEGTVQALVDATGGRMVTTVVHDPLMRKIQSQFGILGDGKTAAIEMAAASGLELLNDDETDPMSATTYGTGELMKKALDEGVEKMIIGIGGSATNDGGTGMASALGAKFLDKNGDAVGPGGGETGKIEKIELDGLDARLKNCSITVAADVTNPLTGEDGAAKVYAAQKGATDEQVEQLEQNMKHFAEVIKKDLAKEIDKTPGAGAAGGLGAGLMVFAGAEIKPGFEVVKDTVKLEEKIRAAGVVITGEGKIDRQTQFGKTPHGVAQLAKKYNLPVIAFAGTLGDKYRELYHKGFDVIFPITDQPMELKKALENAGHLLADAAERMARTMKLSSKIKS